MSFFKKLIPFQTVPKAKDAAEEFARNLEVDILARTLWGEARGEGVLGMEAVASVILNRVAIAKKLGGYWWGNDVIQVCQKPYQFSVWLKSDPQYARLLKVDASDKHFATALRIARRALEGVIADETGGATHYHADYVNPSWANPARKTVTIGRHLFYKLVEV